MKRKRISEPGWVLAVEEWALMEACTRHQEHGTHVQYLQASSMSDVEKRSSSIVEEHGMILGGPFPI
jgi:hypothetical protein